MIHAQSIAFSAETRLSGVERYRHAVTRGFYRVDGERAYVDADQQENQGQRDQQHLERDLAGGLAPLRPFDERDHPVQEGLARVGGDAHDDGVGDHLGAAGDGGAVAARLAHHRGRLAGDGRLVDERRPGDHVAVAGDGFGRLDQDEITFPERFDGDRLERSAELCLFQQLG